MFKNALFQTHWFLGITAGLVMAIMGLTGALYAFQGEIARSARTQETKASAQHDGLMPMGTLIQRLQQQSEGDRIRSVKIELGGGPSDTVTYLDEDTNERRSRAFDPLSGELLPQASGEARFEDFFDLVLNLHRYLAMDDTGQAITGASTLALLISCLTGLYLRWPRRAWDWRAWLVVDWMRKGRSFQWDLHAVFGTWCLVLYLWMALTGLWWSYGWYRDGVRYLLAGTPPAAAAATPPAAAAATPPAAAAATPPPTPDGPVVIDYDRVWQRLRTEAGSELKMARLNWPERAGDPVAGEYRLRSASHPGAIDKMKLDPATGAVLAHERYQDKPFGQQILSSLYYLHTGEYFGLAGRIAFALSSLAMPLFFVTGLWLYLDRRRKRRQARQARQALGALDGGAGEGWLVGFASQSGTAEQLAWRTAGQLQAAGHPVTVQPLARLQDDQLTRARRALFIVSTFGDGNSPDSARGFERKMPAAAPNLGSLRYAVLALGDRQYATFCGFARRVDEWLARHGARALFAPVEVDNGDAQALLRWQQQLGALTGIEPVTESEPEPFADWTLAERRWLNPGSAGAPAYLVSLVPEAPPEWQAGDLLEVQVPDADGGAGVVREYSIASLPADGRVDLIVRQERHEGGYGAGSGWLTLRAPLQGRIQARVRCNRGFHPPEDGRPVVLVGNGTGLAGLRGVLKARIAAGHTRNWMLFGERNAHCDFFCREELEAWRAQGWLARLDLAFSRDQAHKVYVQDRLREAADELRTWVAKGATIYVCGSLEGMAGGVDAVLRGVLGENALLELLDEGRYRRDVY